MTLRCRGAFSFDDLSLMDDRQLDAVVTELRREDKAWANALRR